MTISARIESSLQAAVGHATFVDGPPLLSAAVRHAVFPAGARVRPRLCLAVAAACGDDQPDLSGATAAAIELLHCASLVHDDLPCFDDAATRRGRPSVQHAYGERLAVLAGDALIVLAFEHLARHAGAATHRLAPLIAILGRAVGAPAGIVAGQAWECEKRVDLTEYQRAKTGALFAGATAAGATAAGGNPDAWRALGEWLGAAYQVADDIRDVVADTVALGKPTGQDRAHGRPSSAEELGIVGAVRHFATLVTSATLAVPDCRGAASLRALIRHEAERLLPPELIPAA